MSNSTVLTLSVFGLFFIYITAKGELPTYMGFFMTAGGQVVPDTGTALANIFSQYGQPGTSPTFNFNTPSANGDALANIFATSNVTGGTFNFGQ